MEETSVTITRLLQQWREGERDAEHQLFELVLPRLHRLAQHLMAPERRTQSLQPTELVDDAYLGLVATQDRDWRNRRDFFAIAARAMRRFVIENARGRTRPGIVPPADLERHLPAGGHRLEQAIEIDHHLDALARAEPDWCTIVELKFFMGLTDEETAEAMGLRIPTMQRMWRDARHWLFENVEMENAKRGTR